MRSGLFMNQQMGLLTTRSSSHGNNLSRSHLPLGIISTNTLHRNVGNISALQCLPLLDGRENNTSHLIQGSAEDADTPLDVWTVIRPGHVREKIAIFASEGAQATRTEVGVSNGIPCNGVQPTALWRAPKAKGSWEENCNAKRRRRSCNKQKVQQDSRPHIALPQVVELPLQQLGSEYSEEDGGEQKVSVVEMVAFLEQRASESPNSKPRLSRQRSSTTITLSRALLPEQWGEGTEPLRVSDMVAKLESECMRTSSEGTLSRSNSLRRAVGRVLFANINQSSILATNREQSSTPCMPMPSLPPPAVPSLEQISCPETISMESYDLAQTVPHSGIYTDKKARALTQATPPESGEAEPPPGFLFFSAPPSTKSRTSTVPFPFCDSSLSEQRIEEEAGSPLTRTCASQGFLQLRERVQQLLQPRPFLWALPHHLLLHILRLLPTHSLVALKCTCSYFKVIMETYDVQPADSLWVSDPRYRDDPCKQCKRRYERGDVSLCRWHHKPFCQVLPGGPGYWMCCRGSRRDAPGCNVGLHDNRWVPAFHSIHAPIRRSNNHDD